MNSKLLSVQKVPCVHPQTPCNLVLGQGWVAVSERCKGQVGGYHGNQEEGNEEVEGWQENRRQRGVPVENGGCVEGKGETSGRLRGKEMVKGGRGHEEWKRVYMRRWRV